LVIGEEVESKAQKERRKEGCAKAKGYDIDLTI